jgi:hypothetical protein
VPSHPRPGLFSSIGQKWAELVPDPFDKRIEDKNQRHSVAVSDPDVPE